MGPGFEEVPEIDHFRSKTVWSEHLAHLLGLRSDEWHDNYLKQARATPIQHLQEQCLNKIKEESVKGNEQQI